MKKFSRKTTILLCMTMFESMASREKIFYSSLPCLKTVKTFSAAFSVAMACVVTCLTDLFVVGLSICLWSVSRQFVRRIDVTILTTTSLQGTSFQLFFRGASSKGGKFPRKIWILSIFRKKFSNFLKKF